MTEPRTTAGARVNWRTLLGAALVAVGAVLALAFADLQFFWFEGRPLGIVLAVLGLVEFVNGLRRTRRT